MHGVMCKWADVWAWKRQGFGVMALVLTTYDSISHLICFITSFWLLFDVVFQYCIFIWDYFRSVVLDMFHYLLVPWISAICMTCPVMQGFQFIDQSVIPDQCSSSSKSMWMQMGMLAWESVPHQSQSPSVSLLLWVQLMGLRGVGVLAFMSQPSHEGLPGPRTGADRAPSRQTGGERQKIDWGSTANRRLQMGGI